MFTDGPISDCQQRRAAILRKSQEYRAALCSEAQSLKKAAMWIDLGTSVARKVQSGWGIVTNLFGFWRTQSNESAGIGHLLAKALPLLGPILAFWRKQR